MQNKELYRLKDIKTVFPNSFNVYKKDLVINYIQQKHLGIALNLNVSELTIERYNNNNNSNINLSTNKIIYKENKENKEKEEIDDLNKNNVISNNNPEKIKQFTNYKNSLNNLYKSATKSRFNFVNDKIAKEEVNQIVPSQLNDYITKLFEKHSCIFNQEKHDLSLYYFSLKPSYLDSNDSWSSLISVLKKYNDENELKETDMTKKFYTF